MTVFTSVWKLTKENKSYLFTLHLYVDKRIHTIW